MIRLVATCNDRTIALPLREDLPEITAGSLPENSLYLPYKGISRRHFLLKHADSTWFLRDLQSTNGTLLNGKRIQEAAVRDGDTITAGPVSIRIETLSDDEEAMIFRCSQQGNSESGETDSLGNIELKTDRIPFSFPDLVLLREMILCQSPAMMRIYQTLHSVAKTDLNILFVGETGTGKDFLARMIHLSSNRSRGPYVAVNCAAMPSELVEAELFGIGEKVATNVSQRKGKVASAEGGTLFLDELSSFPFPLQSKILRAIEEKAVTPVGETRVIPVDFRLLSATNEDPATLIASGRLREDLYHRLCTVEICIPPLRERKDDLEVLIPGLIQQISKQESKPISSMTKRLFASLLNYSYPGNLRELTNLLRAMVALAHPGEILDIDLLPQKLAGASKSAASDIKGESSDLRKSVDEFTSNLIHQALTLSEGSIAKAAEKLNVTPFGLRKMMKRLGIYK